MSGGPRRTDGYLPIRDYAVIGNKRTAALVGLDGSIDWLCTPWFDSPSVLGALLDAERGGRFALAPTVEYRASRRYLPDTNVLETTFETGQGTVRVVDALALPTTGRLPWTELARSIEGVAGEVPMRWSLEPRFDYGQSAGRFERRQGVPVAVHGSAAVAVQSWDAGDPDIAEDRVGASFTVREGEAALLALAAFHGEPYVFSLRAGVQERLSQTIDLWRRWAAQSSYDGPWREAVMRSALTLELLVCEPTGAMAAAPTTSLPERVGASRNFDYRYSWLRDTNFALDAMVRLGYREQVHASLSWMLSAISRTAPLLQPFYKLDGGVQTGGQGELALAGYRGSAPVFDGNSAEGQLQLGNYGDVLETCWLYVSQGNALDGQTSRTLADVADYVCEVWRNPDAGIWELGQWHDYTQSKIACWIALTRALRLANAGQLETRRRARWQATCDEIREFVERHCWSERQQSYNRYRDSDELDAAVLLAARAEYTDPGGERMNRTIDALRRELGAGGPLLYRYSGMRDQEGAFLACSFWLVEALARAGRFEEAAQTMDEMLALGSDVGLYSEEIDPASGEFRGNLPQALTHLALVNAAAIYHQAESSR